MDKWKTRILLRVLEEGKLCFPEATKFIEDCLEKECSKENISVKEVILFYIPESRELAQKKHFLFCSVKF